MRLQQDQREAMSSLAEAAGREKALKARRSALSPHPRVATRMRWNQRAVAWVPPPGSRAPPIPPDTGMGYTFVSRQGCECAPALDTTVPARGSQAVARAICLGERSVAQGRIIATQPEPAPAALAPEPEGPPPFEAEEADAASAMIARGQLRLCLGRQAEGLQSDVDQLHARGETDQPSTPQHRASPYSAVGAHRRMCSLSFCLPVPVPVLVLVLVLCDGRGRPRVGRPHGAAVRAVPDVHAHRRRERAPPGARYEYWHWHRHWH